MGGESIRRLNEIVTFLILICFDASVVSWGETEGRRLSCEHWEISSLNSAVAFYYAFGAAGVLFNAGFTLYIIQIFICSGFYK